MLHNGKVDHKVSPIINQRSNTPSPVSKRSQQAGSADDGPPHVLIIGGGIAGLCAAWQLQQQGISYTLLEAAGRLGGMIWSERFDGYVVDGGAESFITRKPELWQLTQTLGLTDRVVPASTSPSGAAVYNDGRPMRVPLGPVEFLTTPMLSWRGKLRLIAEPFIPPRRDDGDETIAAFASRRLGAEASDRFISPILSGIYNSDASRQSIMTTAGVMRDLEKHGSLIAGTIATMRKRRAEKQAGAPQIPRSFTFAQGAQEVVDVLAQKLTGTVRCNARVIALSRSEAGYAAQLADGSRVTATGVILAAPANTVAPMLAAIAPEASRLLGQIRFASIGTVALAFPTQAVQTRYNINSLMIPRRLQRKIDAVVWRPNNAPAGHTLLRVFFGGATPAMMNLDDEQLVSEVRAELAALVDITAQPLAYRVFRWPHGFPQADVGHLQLVDQIEAALPPTIALAGNSYRGIGAPDCARQGFAAATELGQLIQATASAPQPTTVR